MLTLQNLVKNELTRAKYRNECPLNDENIAVIQDPYESLSDSLPPTLTPEEQQVMLLSYEEQLDTKEIAQRLRITEGSVRGRLFRARQKYKNFSENKKIFVTKSASEYIKR